MFSLSRKNAIYMLLFCLLCVGGVLGCARTTIPLTQISVPMPTPLTFGDVLKLFKGYKEGNFYSLSWTEAFNGMHAKLSREYPLTDWKEIDWDALYDVYQPRIVAAEESGDEAAYYLALREYIFNIPDGYVRITAPDVYREAAIGGDYGLSILPLDDGRVIVGDLEEDGFAEHSGIRWGAEIIDWNGQPVRDALESVSVLWSDSPPATSEYTLFEKCMLLTRAPIGTEATILFRNPGQESLWGTRLRARRDMFRGLEDLTRQGKPFSEFESPFESRILEENIGYIKVYCQSPTLTMPFPARAFRKIIDRFIAAGVQGIVFDLRGNTGGADELAATFAGHFTEKPLFFRNVVAFDEKKGGFALRDGERLIVEPRMPVFNGPVAILIHRNTRDSGQAIVHTLAPLEHVIVVGALATEGSYAFIGDEITMPGGHIITYPVGRMLDEAGGILVASGADMESRVRPEIRTPFTLENLDIFFNQGGDPVLAQAIAEIRQRVATEETASK